VTPRQQPNGKDALRGLRFLLEDVQSYVEQAQIVVGETDRKGASILHGIGGRLEIRLQDAMDALAVTDGR